MTSVIILTPAELSEIIEQSVERGIDKYCQGVAAEARTLSPEDVRKLARCSRDAVYDALKSGALKSSKSGANWKILTADAAAWIKSKKTISGPARPGHAREVG